MSWSERLGGVGVWRPGAFLDRDLATAIEELGFGRLWLGGSPASDLCQAEDLLDATTSLQLATGIVNIWASDAAELADSYHRIESRHPGRLLLGIGSGHREADPERVRPVDAMARYLDVLDARGVPVQSRVLSALGPRMLAVASERSAGTHPSLPHRPVAERGGPCRARPRCARRSGADRRPRHRRGVGATRGPQVPPALPGLVELHDHDAAGRLHR
ncbi:LLM class flavin-dependent oxidoreductase [Actinoplanes missouriensis]|uniref:LLM class flavin-dependent oxidoreductase n=1 Tax=Actinoplanes missouriensis TaxID=1866 RepID=UPI0033D80844